MLKAKEDRPTAAMAVMLLTFLLFTGIDASAKWLMQAGMALFAVVFWRYFIHLAFVVVTSVIAGDRGFWRMRRPWMTLARASTLVVGTTTNFLVLSQLPMAVIVAIYFTTPLATTALAALFLGEKVGARRWTAIFVGFVGVLIITQPWAARFEPAMALCLIVVAVTAVYILLTRRLAGEESAETMQFWAAALPTICLAPIAFSVWSWPAGGVDWIFFALIGFFGWAGHQCWTVALRLAEASALAPLQYVQIIYAALAGWVLFGDRPGLWTLIGAAVIIASGVYVWLRERRLNVA